MKQASNKLPYVFWWNDKMYEVDPDVFSKLSKKFNIVREQNPTQFIVSDLLTQDTFEAFIAACQFKPFDVNKNNCFQLLSLAVEWKVASLESFVKRYIQEHQLKEVVEDHLGILIEKIKNNMDNHSHWAAVAKNVNGALADERFLTVPAEVIFQILAIGDKKGINQRLLIDFVMKLFDIDPPKAIPLILRLDFSQMTKEEIERIYLCRKVHEQNISFFIASSLSAASNKSTISVENSQKRRDIELQVIKAHIKRSREQKLAKLSQDYQKEIEEIQEEISRQQTLINMLEGAIKTHKESMEAEEKKQRLRRIPIATEDLERIKSACNEQLTQTRETNNKYLASFIERMNSLVLETPRASRAFFADAAAKSDSETTRARSSLLGLEYDANEATNVVSEAKSQLKNLRSVLCAKVIRDKFRFDQFLRRKQNIYRVFDQEEGIWRITGRDVQNAEEELKQIEARIDKLCPIRQTAVLPQ